MLVLGDVDHHPAGPVSHRPELRVDARGPEHDLIPGAQPIRTPRQDDGVLAGQDAVLGAECLRVGVEPVEMII